MESEHFRQPLRATEALVAWLLMVNNEKPFSVAASYGPPRRTLELAWASGLRQGSYRIIDWYFHEQYGS